MSVEAITWVISQKVTHSSAKFVLVMLANCADGKDFVAWPSVAYLSECTGQDRKTVLENLKRLKEAGLIEDTGERKGSTKQVTVYRLKCPVNGTVKEAQKRDSTENGTVPDYTDNSPVIPVKQSRFSVETVPKTGHGTVKEPSIEPSRKQKRGADAPPCPDDVDKQVYGDWLQLRKAKNAPVTETVLKNARTQSELAGMTLTAFFEIWCARGSVGLQADWLRKTDGKSSPANIHKFAAAARTIFGDSADDRRTINA